MTWINSLLLLSSVLMLLKAVSGAKVIMTSPQYLSHILKQVELGSELVKRGHEVYVAVGSRFPKLETISEKGVKVLLYHVPDDVLYGISEEMDELFGKELYRKIQFQPLASDLSYRDCRFMMEDRQFLEQVRNLSFDLAIVEPFFLTQCCLLLPHYLHIPFVSMTTNALPWKFRLPALPSFYPMFGESISLFSQSSFLERFQRLIYYVENEFGLLLPGVQNVTLLERFAPDVGSWGELVRESELILITTDHHIGRVLPAFPNIVTVAGLTCRPPKKLESHFESLVGSSDHGVILMSFGSMAYYMPEDILLKFLEVFSRLNETIIVRLPAREGVEIPKNVHLVAWTPQNDILGHPNTKLFITHCGVNGQYEALFHGVPMIGFPFFVEQSMNCRLAAEKGFGFAMNIHDFTSEELFNNIQEVLNNSKYRMAIKKASERFLNEPMSPREKAVFWVEYVIKFGGHHLRSPANDLPLYQFLMIDIIFTLFLIFSILICSMKCVVEALFRKTICPRKSNVKEKSQ